HSTYTVDQVENHHLKNLKRQDLSFSYEYEETKKPALCHLSQWVLHSRSRLKIIKRQVVFSEKSIQTISTFKPLIIFILSVSVCLPKAVLSKNKILSSFGWIAKRTKPLNKKRYEKVILASCANSLFIFFQFFFLIF